MRVVADFVGGELDGRLEMLPEPIEELHLPSIKNFHSFELLPGVEAGVVEVARIVYIRDEMPKAIEGDIFIFAYRLERSGD